MLMGTHVSEVPRQMLLPQKAVLLYSIFKALRRNYAVADDVTVKVPSAVLLQLG
jgi:hypothetical protein